MSNKFIKFTQPIKIESVTDGEIPERIYPMVQPPLNLYPIQDETGFTRQEKKALRMCWNLLKPKTRNIGQDVSYKFLVKNHTYINLFRDQNDPKCRLKLKELHRHALLAFEVFGFIIEHCLSRNRPLIQSFQNIIRIHKSYKVSSKKVLELVDEIAVKFCSELVNHYSETITRGLYKIRKQIRFIYRLINTRLKTNELYGIESSHMRTKTEQFSRRITHQILMGSIVDFD